MKNIQQIHQLGVYLARNAVQIYAADSLAVYETMSLADELRAG